MATNIVKIVAANGPAHVVLDYSHPPFILNKWVGSPDMSLLDDLYAARDTFALVGPPPWTHVYIHDFSEMVAPSSTVRKYTADKQNNDPQLPNMKMLLISSVPNTILRGMMTAIVWMTGKDNMPTEFTSSMTEAINRGIKVCEMWGIAPPAIDPVSYRFPTDAPVWSRKK